MNTAKALLIITEVDELPENNGVKPPSVSDWVGLLRHFKKCNMKYARIDTDHDYKTVDAYKHLTKTIQKHSEFWDIYVKKRNGDIYLVRKDLKP